jgi:anaphase-promoting complex subunit 2
LRESHTISDGEIVYTIVETMGDAGGRTAGGTMAANDAAVPLLSEEDGESAVASMEDQWQQEMSVYESYVVGMLTNFDSLPLDRIHNMLKVQSISQMTIAFSFS